MNIPKRFLIMVVVLLISALACGSSSDGVVVVEPEEPVTGVIDEPVVAEEIVSDSDEEVVEEDVVTEEIAVEPTKKPGTARSNPAPVGSEVVADDMSFVILGSTRPADDIIKAGNMFNTEPEEGEEYILVELRIECLKSSDDKCSISQFNFKMIGDAGVQYDSEWFVAGVSGLLESEDFYGGSEVSGSLPYIVKQSDVNLIFVYEPFWGDTFYLQVP